MNLQRMRFKLDLLEDSAINEHDDDDAGEPHPAAEGAGLAFVRRNVSFGDGVTAELTVDQTATASFVRKVRYVHHNSKALVFLLI